MTRRSRRDCDAQKRVWQVVAAIEGSLHLSAPLTNATGHWRLLVAFHAAHHSHVAPLSMAPTWLDARAGHTLLLVERKPTVSANLVACTASCSSLFWPQAGRHLSSRLAQLWRHTETRWRGESRRQLVHLN
jgi:hypothetical protein